MDGLECGGKGEVDRDKMSREAYIRPTDLPENLENLHRGVEEVRLASKAMIAQVPMIADDLNLVYAALDALFNITNAYDHGNDDELTVQFLGLRMFNTITSSLELLLSGYYQSSVILMRDLLETGYLLDYFTIVPDHISEWKNCTNKERQRKFQPAKLRQALDKRDGFEERSREQIYQTVCEYAVHPTYMGNKLVSPDGLGIIGPFFDVRFLRALLKELAMRAPYFVLVYLAHFPRLPAEFAPLKQRFLDVCTAWSDRYGPHGPAGAATGGLSELV